MRKGFDGLSGIVSSQMGRSPLDGGVYLFINRRRDRMKLLVWEPGGYTLYYKRLESGTFELPQVKEGEDKMIINWESLMLILGGISLKRIVKRKRYKRA